MKTIGIIGGMGTHASNYFLHRIASSKIAFKDSDYHPVILISDTTMSDDHISDSLRNYSEKLIKHSTTLEALGVDMIVIACITAHIWIDKIQDRIDIPVINLVEMTQNEIDKLDKPPFLLSSPHTARSGLFKNVEIVDRQDIVDRAIESVKIGYPDASEIFWLTHNQVVVLGCSELPLISNFIGAKHIIDPFQLFCDWLNRERR